MVSIATFFLTLFWGCIHNFFAVFIQFLHYFSLINNNKLCSYENGKSIPTIEKFDEFLAAIEPSLSSILPAEHLKSEIFSID